MTISDETSDETIDGMLASWLRDAAMPDGVGRLPRARLLQRIDIHGIGPTLSRMAEAAPGDLVDALHARLIAREFWEAQHGRILADALEALVRAGLRPLLFKGTALARSIYPTAAERVRGDSDILVEEDGRDAAVAALTRAGFRTPRSAGGEVLVGEMLFRKADPTGNMHDMDLHWRFNNSLTLSRLFSHSGFLTEAEPLSGPGPEAHRIGNVDALLVACLHRRLHIGGTSHTVVNGVPFLTPDSLTWLRDMDLLARSFEPRDWGRFWSAARSKGIADVCAKGLADARSALGTPLPPSILEAQGEARAGRVETYLRASSLARFRADFGAASGIGAKLRFLMDLGLPPADYMRARFGRDGRGWLPLLYLKRAFGGLRAARRRRPRR